MNAQKDANNTSSLMAVLNTNGKTTVTIAAEPTRHALMCVGVELGMNNGPIWALKDDNSVSTLVCVSSTDFKTPVAVYGDINDNLFIQT
jgi:hypothetical protein